MSTRRVSVEVTAIVSRTEKTAQIKNVDLFNLYQMFGFRVTILRQGNRIIMYSQHPRVQDMLFTLLPLMAGFAQERVQVKVQTEAQNEPKKVREWCPPFYSQ